MQPVRVNSLVLSLRVTGVWNRREIEIGEDQHNKKDLWREWCLSEA